MQDPQPIRLPTSRALEADRVVITVSGDELATTNDEEVSFERSVSQRPHYAAALVDIEAALWEQGVVSLSLLELCRLRIAQLLGCGVALVHRTPEAVAAGFDEGMVNSLSQWPTDARFSDEVRACLGYAEQLLIDAQAVSDEQANHVINAVGQGGFLVLTYACGLFETTQRARLILGATGW
jgi:alkylhydroperoxidase family enzyme